MIAFPTDRIRHGPKRQIIFFVLSSSPSAVMDQDFELGHSPPITCSPFTSEPLLFPNGSLSLPAISSSHSSHSRTSSYGAESTYYQQPLLQGTYARSERAESYTDSPRSYPNHRLSALPLDRFRTPSSSSSRSSTESYRDSPRTYMNNRLSALPQERFQTPSSSSSQSSNNQRFQELEAECAALAHRNTVLTTEAETIR